MTKGSDPSPEVGSRLPTLRLPPLSRTTLALYAGGSGDHNPLHIDTDFARREGGRTDVIGHGMLTVAYLARAITAWRHAAALKSLTTRFVAPTAPGDSIRCEATVVALSQDGQQRIAHVSLRAVRGADETLATAEAAVVLR
ncbi:MaoC/PaaZ C-terminal domain-containing protein [Erythrobacter sp. AP23]|uniref:MaoC/PaaZ C-terminal domain-containing protein n=1 Tax=Erythrobacter sp. AP23 TaxID=499656 RepID=UPI00076BCA16|nr:MaoC/PaaZ C-terminal domain-containing protein [Erythrobacter sp. AP23]KWV93776.1 hypothetical protein ASS64_12840 [Erythrobacter sp. AP23]